MAGQPVVIIGTGLAGYATAKELRKHDCDVALVMVSADSGYSYSKPMLSSAIGRRVAVGDLPNGDVAHMSKTLDAEIRTQCTVTGLCPASHTIECDGKPLKYSKLVLALGAAPRQLRFGGDAAHEVMSVNDLEDYAAFADVIAQAQTVACIGAGLIGSEFANSLAAGGWRVEAIEPFEYPLGRLVPPEAGEAVRQALSALGVRFHLGETCEQVNRDGQRYRLTLSNGEQVHADAVLSAVGLVPRTQLAEAAGLATDAGIVVNRELATSHPDIYALGDCMQMEGMLLPYILPITHAARALGKTLAGEPTRVSYPVMPVVVKTPAHPVVVAPPPRGTTGSWQVDADDDGIRALFVGADGMPVGFVLTGSKVADKNALAKTLPAVLP